jgi:hypothetical protein
MKIKGILIDVEKRQIREVEFENELSSYYRLLKCDCITTAPFDEKHDVIVDDEGLLKTPFIGFFETPDGDEYAGHGLIVGFNDDGDWISHKLNFETVKNSIRFIQYVRLNGTLLKIVLQPSNIKR